MRASRNPSSQSSARIQSWTWYAFRLGPTTYGIFDTFANEDDRGAHLNGQIPAALGQIGADLLAGEPDIRQIDIVAVK